MKYFNEHTFLEQISWSFDILSKQKRPPEVFYKKLFLKIAQYSQENKGSWISMKPVTIGASKHPREVGT